MSDLQFDSKYFDEIPCNNCGLNDYSIKYQVNPTTEDVDFTEMFSSSSGIVGKDQIVACSECGLIYVNPRLKPEIILRGYSEGHNENYVSQSIGRIETFTKGLSYVEKFAPSKGKILDVGAAAGFFLKVAKDNGWETFGVEPSEWLVDYGNKNFQVNMTAGTLIGSKFNDDSFDVITMWDVLEHTSDPMAEMKEVHRVLKPRGIALINYPNIGSLLSRLAGKNWWFILSVHLYYYTPKTITMLMEKAGFEILDSR